MNTDRNGIALTDNDLKEIFSLLTSSTKDEKVQTYQRGGSHYYESENLSEEYSLTQEKREFALDAWRAVISVLQARGFTLTTKDGKKLDLGFIEKEFV